MKISNRISLVWLLFFSLKIYSSGGVKRDFSNPLEHFVSPSSVPPSSDKTLTSVRRARRSFTSERDRAKDSRLSFEPQSHRKTDHFGEDFTPFPAHFPEDGKPPQSSFPAHSSEGEAALQSSFPAYSSEGEAALQSSFPAHSSEGEAALQSSFPAYSSEGEAALQSSFPAHLPERAESPLGKEPFRSLIRSRAVIPRPDSPARGSTVSLAESSANPDKKSPSPSISGSAGLLSARGRPGRTLLLTPGERMSLPLPDNHRVYVGQKDLLFFQAEGSRLILSGKREGETFLRLKNKIYPVLVVKKELKRHILLVDRLLKGFWGLEWSLHQGRIQITGRMNRLYDWIELAELARMSGISYRWTASPGEGLRESAKRFFTDLFQERAGLPPPDIQWPSLPLARVPEGRVEEYQALLEPFGLVAEPAPLWFVPAPLIQIETALLETSKSSSLAVGGISQIFSFRDLLNLLVGGGKGRLLHHSSLVAQNGREIKIHSGGQIPFTQYNLETHQQSLRWKSHGLTLRITPQLDGKGALRLKIQGEISQPLSHGGSNPPPLKTQNISGVFDMGEGEIIKLIHIKKRGRGMHFNGGLPLPLAGKGGGRVYRMSRMVFLRASVLKDRKKESDHPFLQNGNDK